MRGTWGAVVIGAILVGIGVGRGADADKELVIEKDIVFGKGGDVDLKLDLYRQKSHVDDEKSVQPGLIVIYGGAWRSGNKEVMRIFCEQFARAGYVVAAVSYRLFPDVRFPAAVEDCKCGVRWMRENAATYRIDPKKIGAMGASAGGHLAMMLGYMDDSDGLQGNGGHEKYSSQVQCVVNYFGPFDLTLRDWKSSDEHLLVDFLGDKLDKIPDTYQKASPSHYVDADDAPTITLHGTQDPIVPYGQGTLVDATLGHLGIDSRLELVKGAVHGWWGADLQRTQKASIEFLDKHLKGPKSAASEK